MATTSENTEETSSDNFSQRIKARRSWTSGNFDVVEVFEDENQLNEWFSAVGGGGDWVIECKRETRTHHVTEFICRFSRKYSGRRLNGTPYDCHSRLRIRRPLNLDMDQSLIVEKTTADHDHEPKENSSFQTNEELFTRSESTENNEDDISKDLNEKTEISSLISDDRDDPGIISTGIAPEMKDLIKEKFFLGWDARKIQNFMMTERMNVPTIQEICIFMGALQQQVDGDKLSAILDQKSTTDAKIAEFTKQITQLGKTIVNGFEQHHKEDNLKANINGSMTNHKTELDLDEMEEQMLGEEMIIIKPESVEVECENEIVKENSSTDNNGEIPIDDDNKIQETNEENKFEKGGMAITNVKEDNKLQIESTISDSGAGTEEDLSPNLTEQTTSKFGSKSKNNKQPKHDNYLARPKRNRTRRLYSPSPPSRLSIEPKRKKEKSVSADSNREISASPSLHNMLIDGKIRWAKEPPKQAHIDKFQKSQQKLNPHLINKSSANLTSDKSSEATNLLSTSTIKSRSSRLNLSTKKLHSTSNKIYSPPAPINQINSNLIHQNEKWSKENAQLKQQNQEQQQQIQALINANRELIWAFNESRREHSELMVQLRLLVKPSNNNNTTTIRALAPKSSANSHAEVQKRLLSASSAATSTSHTYPDRLQLRKRRRKSRLTSSQTTAQPFSMAISSNKQHQHNNINGGLGQQDFTSPETKRPKTANEQLMAMVDIKQEQICSEHTIINASENNRNETIVPPSHTMRKLTKEEEIAKIKLGLQLLPTSPVVENYRLIGSRRPAFFTPTEHGDWHSIISGDIRKQLVLQIFQALCPEIKQKSIEEYIKTYPSRGNYIQKSVDYSFDTENELFVAAEDREAYFTAIATKMYCLSEVVSRFSMTSPSKTTPMTRKLSRTAANTTTAKKPDISSATQQQKKRTLADLLKPKRPTTHIDASQIKDEQNGNIQQNDDDYDGVEPTIPAGDQQ